MRYFILLISFFVVAQAIPQLTLKDIQAIKQQISKLESQGKGGINAENSKGYLGKYQFGAAALVSTGLLKLQNYNRDTYINPATKSRQWKKNKSNKSFLNDRTNWLLSDGKNSFLGNNALQELSMDELIKKNYLSLDRIDHNITSKQELFGFLVAAHLGGFSSAVNYIKEKKEFKDGYGTSISKYYLAGTQIKIDQAAKEVQGITKLSKEYLGTDYVWGGENTKGFDCSGFTKYIFEKKGVALPRTALEQSKKGIEISKDKLTKGDLLFFLTDRSRNIPITHVGLYLGDNKFIHAASKKEGVIISDIKEYKSQFVKAKRILSPNSTYASIGVNDNSIKYEIIDGRYQRVN